MKPTQNNQSGEKGQPVVHRMPRRYTPDIDRLGQNGTKKSAAPSSAPAQRKSSPQGQRPASSQMRQPPMPKRRKKTTLLGAVAEELEERFEGLTIGLPFTAEQFIRGLICAALIVFFAMLQTTVFARFKFFGTTPDLMFALTIAIAFSEGEKWGGVCGLICAIVIDSLSGYGLTLLPIAYVAAGVLCGNLVRDFFSNTALPRIAVITLFTIGRSVISLISASFLVNITFLEIMSTIIIPEYFSTVIMSAPVYFIVWACFVRFHKTRAEKTGVDIH